MDSSNVAYGSEDVSRAQLRSALSNIAVTVSANSFIAISAALLVYDERGSNLIFLWLAAVISLNMVRLRYGLKLSKTAQSDPNPKKTLQNLTILAFVAGLFWVPLPSYFLDSIQSRTVAYIVFIMAGISTGAIIQSLAYWRISVAFGGPILAATIGQLLLQGRTVDFVVATNVFLLMAMLFRIAVTSEHNFRKNYETTLQAKELAASLQQAKEEVEKANETLKHLATTDPLTGLPNRSVFNQLLAALTHNREKVALALVDIDQFKTVNDSLGHAAGDQILCSAALFMLDNAGEGITATRLGGDEFAVIASGPDCNIRMMQFAEALQRDMKTIGALPGQAGAPPVTVSVGICTDDGGRMNASELFAETDRALYMAKAAGRNCIRVATGVTRTPARIA